MKQKESEQQTKERMIKYAASLGITLTVIDRPSEKNLFPEKLEEANRILANTKPDKK
ncbi:MAG TPA: hypothetical protein VF008_09115 [Niastella sp.]